MGPTGTKREKSKKQNSPFLQADFILICVSETYINETERGQSEVTESTSDKQLHTDYIYQLMVMEYNQIGRNRRFIPVMLDGTTEEHIPSWLQSTLVYKWPLHFRDLLWFLTKPETRIDLSVKMIYKRIFQELQKTDIIKALIMNTLHLNSQHDWQFIK